MMRLRKTITEMHPHLLRDNIRLYCDTEVYVLVVPGQDRESHSADSLKTTQYRKR